MTIKQMIQQNNLLRERMTPANHDYVVDVIVFVRSSRVDRQMAEKRLLETAEAVLEGQEQGRSAVQLFGEDAEAYGQSIVESLPHVKPLAGMTFYLMIPWAALTTLFLLEAVVGFVAEWTGYQGSPLNRISLLALILLAIGSILLTELVMKTLNKTEPGTSTGTGEPKINLRAIIIYLVILVIVMVIGYSMRTMLPVFTVKPWVSLVIGLVGLAGIKLIFMRRA